MSSKPAKSGSVKAQSKLKLKKLTIKDLEIGANSGPKGGSTAFQCGKAIKVGGNISPPGMTLG